MGEVSVSMSDLMAPEKHKTLLLEPSLVSANTLEIYISKGYFKEGDCQPPKGESTPEPRDGEVVVFWDFFTTGLRLPVDPVVPLLMVPSNVKLHHLTPNAIVQQSKFIWVVRTFRGVISVAGFMSSIAEAEKLSRKARWSLAKRKMRDVPSFRRKITRRLSWIELSFPPLTRTSGRMIV